MSTPLPNLPHPNTAIMPNSDESRPQESNVGPQVSKCDCGKHLRKVADGVSAFCPCSNVNDWQGLTLDDNSTTAAINAIAATWPFLPPHVREAILTLVDAGQLWNAGKENRHDFS